MDSRKISVIGSCLFMFLMFASTQSTASVYLPMSTDTLAKEAQTVVRGKVKDLKSEWNENKTFIWTIVTLSVTSSLKGADMKDKEVQIKIPGGVVEGVGQRQSDEVTFEKGEEAVVFLGKETYKGKELFNVIGLVQGKFKVENGKVKNMPVESFMQEIHKALSVKGE